MSVEPFDTREVLGIEPEQMPRHVAVIMDGNGRWARARNLARREGHVHGAETVRTIVTDAARLQLEALTLYSFSRENWSRPKDEVSFLMDLYAQYLVSQRDVILGNNVRLIHVGRRDLLPPSVLAEMDKTIELSSGNTGLKLCLALNYGARMEITDAVRSIAQDVKAGRVEPEAIDEDLVAARLYTGGLPDPDLLIRTGGEHRVSNFLLWQISYAEIVVCDLCWPDFGVEAFHEAIREFARRDRRFGGVKAPA